MNEKPKFYLKAIIWVVTVFVLISLLIFPSLIRAYDFAKKLNVNFSTIYKKFWNKPFESLKYCLSTDVREIYLYAVGILAIALFTLLIIAIIQRNRDQGYEGIEHGSGDWATGDRKSTRLNSSH